MSDAIEDMPGYRPPVFTHLPDILNLPHFFVEHI